MAEPGFGKATIIMDSDERHPQWLARIHTSLPAKKDRMVDLQQTCSRAIIGRF